MPLIHLPLWVERWFFSSNHKDIGSLYLFFVFCAGIIWFLFNLINIELKFPGSQIILFNFFQNPDLNFMERIINLHHEIMFYLIILSVLVFWFLVRINFFFVKTSNTRIQEPSKITHNTVLEVVWTIIPCILLLLIAIPSLTLIYSFQPLNKSNVVFKIIGNQWWWAYEYEILKKNKITFIWVENFNSKIGGIEHSWKRWKFIFNNESISLNAYDLTLGKWFESSKLNKNSVPPAYNWNWSKSLENNIIEAKLVDEINSTQLLPLGFEPIKKNQNLIFDMIKSGGSTSRRAGQLIYQNGTEISSSLGNEFTFSELSNKKKKLFNFIYRNHPKILVKIFPDFTLSVLGCTTLPTKLVFGSTDDFLYHMSIEGGNTYTAPGFFVWKTGTIVDYLPEYVSEEETFPVNSRSFNEKAFLEALDKLESPSWEDLQKETFNYQQHVFEVINFKKKN